MRTFFAILVTSVAVLSTHASTPREGSRCNSDPVQAYELRFHVQQMLTDQSPARRATRSGMHLPEMDSSQVVAVSVDSLCRRAAALINALRNRPDSASNLVTMVSFGKWYMAEDTTSTDMHWKLEFLLDGRLTKVLYTTGR